MENLNVVPANGQMVSVSGLLYPAIVEKSWGRSRRDSGLGPVPQQVVIMARQADFLAVAQAGSRD